MSVPATLQRDSAWQGSRAYLVLAFGIVAFLIFLDRSIFSVLAVSIKRDAGLSDTEIGLLGGFAFALFYAVLGLPLARLADRNNRVRLVPLCLAVWSAATAVCGLAGRSFPLLPLPLPRSSRLHNR